MTNITAWCKGTNENEVKCRLAEGKWELPIKGMYAGRGQRQLINVHTCGPTLLTEYDFGGRRLLAPCILFIVRYMISSFGEWTTRVCRDNKYWCIFLGTRPSSYLPFEKSMFNFPFYSFFFFYLFLFFSHIYIISTTCLRHFKDPTQSDDDI